MSTVDFMQWTYLRNEQSLHTTTELLIGPAGLVTRKGDRLIDRLPAALPELCAQGLSVFSPKETTTFSSVLRRANRAPCSMCSMMPGHTCIRCRDKRSWSYLKHSWTLHFCTATEIPVDFTIEGCVLPFISTSDDGGDFDEVHDDCDNDSAEVAEESEEASLADDEESEEEHLQEDRMQEVP